MTLFSNVVPGNKLSNKESARNSRIRKKLYIDLLEAKIQQLSHQVIHQKKIRFTSMFLSLLIIFKNENLNESVFFSQ
jgi:bZIP transcription factor